MGFGAEGAHSGCDTLVRLPIPLMMTAATPNQTPLLLVLEFARTEEAGDPYAFRLEPQTYLLRSAGGGFESIEIGWDKTLLDELAAVRLPGREPTLAQRLGELMRHFLQPAGWPQYEVRILEAVAAQRPVILTVRSAAAELYALPWELCTLKSTGQHVGELPGVLLRYEWPETATTPEPPRARRGRILVCWSAAGGTVPAAELTASITRACQAAAHPFVPERDLIAHTSLERLAEALEQAQRSGQPIAVLHLLCHGAAAGPTFGLALDSEQPGKRTVVDAARLRQVLAPHVGMVRLVVLAACDASNSGVLGNQLGSVAQALHRAGIAQVVASRYPISVAGSLRLAEVLYAELLGKSEAARPASLEAALLRVRQQLACDATHLDWAALQLYARAADGEFQPPAHLPTAEKQPKAHGSGGATRAAVALALVLSCAGAAGGIAAWRAQKSRERRPPAAAISFVHWTVTTEPAGAQIVQLTSGEVLGVTPWRHEQVKGSGTLRIELRRPGYEPKQLQLELAADAKYELTLDMKPLF